MVGINYIYSNETGKISDKYSLYVTPSGLFFLIWPVIFATMLFTNLYNLIKNVWSLASHIYLALTNTCLIIWINVFNVGEDPAVFICFPILVLTVIIALRFWIELGKVDEITKFIYIGRNVYAFFLGWIIAASNLNFGMIIKYWWGSTYETQLIIFWVLAPLCAIVATVFNTVREGKKGILSCLCLWISVIWAFTGAAIRSNDCLTDPNSCLI